MSVSFLTIPPARSGEEIALAMSGGVDSTAAALLLRDQGYVVRGFFMDLPLSDRESRLRKVEEVATRLRLSLEVLDLRAYFHTEVLVPFVRAYQSGRTPNPCCRCNPLIKFGALARAAEKMGLARLATGHYARSALVKEGEKHYQALYRALHPAKDQSYFLAGLDAGQVEAAVFPLGGLSKRQACLRAEEAGFSFCGEESQDVCFLPRGLRLADFLSEQGLPGEQGEIVSVDGRRLGRHQGIWHYTIGQRRGLGISDTTPWYVVELDSCRNQVLVGKEEHLLRHDCLLRDPHWIHGEPELPWHGQVRLRSRHQAAEARLELFAGDGAEETETKTMRLRFTQAQRAITPGQFAVFQQGERVLGCAVIDSHKPSSCL